MNGIKLYPAIGLLMCFLVVAAPATADVWSQCVIDDDPNDSDNDGDPYNDHLCLHLAAGDGFVNMADGRLQYMFGFNDVTYYDPEDPQYDPNNPLAHVPDDQVMMEGMLAAEFPGPTIVAREGQKVYLSLTNVGMMMRPDLFDPHTIHWHGFPQAASIFDGVPDASIAVNMGSTLTYYYNVVEPGTYMWHCHVEATEHMQMGMLAQVYVLPIQNTLADGTDLNGFLHHTGYKYAYNDGDGSTHYDVDYPIQISAFDPDFHDASLAVQPLPFAYMTDKYPMLNGRGYPDTVNPDPILNSASDLGVESSYSQRIPALIEATQGERVLLRISSLSTTSFHTLKVLGIPMRVVGQGARLLRGADPDGDGPLLGADLSYETTSVTLGGGEAKDVILDTSGVEAGTYFLYVANLDHLSNNTEDYGGMMTEIRIAAAPPPQPGRGTLNPVQRNDGPRSIGRKGSAVPRVP
jgi:FtsP/CotA-like multicopper oxidase with cupredoxin domain